MARMYVKKYEKNYAVKPVEKNKDRQHCPFDHAHRLPISYM